MNEATREIGLFDVVMLAAGTAIGVSVFSALGPGARIAGAGMVIAIPIAMLPMAIFCAVYSFMSAVVPRSGASFEWPRMFISPGVAFLVTWLRILGSVGMLVTNSLVLARYLSRLHPIPILPSRFLILLLIFAINQKGIYLAAKLQTAAMGLLLLLLTVLVAASPPQIDLARIGAPLGAGWLPIVLCLPLMVKLFSGLETGTEIGEEVRDARRTIPRALLIALAITTIVYSAIAFVSLSVLGPATLSQSAAPMYDLGDHLIGGYGSLLVTTAATASLLKSLNSIFLSFSRYLFAMSRAGALPAWIAGPPNSRKPLRNATITAFALTCCGLLLPSDLIFLFIAAIIPDILKYFSTCLSSYRLASHWPHLIDPDYAPFGAGIAKLFAVLGMGAALLLLVIGVGTDWRPYLLIAAWALGGGLYWFIAVRPRSAGGTRS